MQTTKQHNQRSSSVQQAGVYFSSSRITRKRRNCSCGWPGCALAGARCRLGLVPSRVRRRSQPAGRFSTHDRTCGGLQAEGDCRTCAGRSATSAGFRTRRTVRRRPNATVSIVLHPQTCWKKWFASHGNLAASPWRTSCCPKSTPMTKWRLRDPSHIPRLTNAMSILNTDAGLVGLWRTVVFSSLSISQLHKLVLQAWQGGSGARDFRGRLSGGRPWNWCSPVSGSLFARLRSGLEQSLAEPTSPALHFPGLTSPAQRPANWCW